MTRTLKGYTYDFHIEQRYSPITGKSMMQLTLAVPGGGCKYWIKTRGRGCTFCGFPGLTRRLNLGDGREDFFGGWLLKASIFKEMYFNAIESSNAVDKLAIFNGGSFFVDTELPPAFRATVIRDASKRKNLRQIMVESRPEYITPSALAEAEPILAAGQDFVIGIGVESANDRVRNKLLKKGMHRGAIRKAIELMQKHGVKVFAYAFLKAPGLTEKQAIVDARETLAYLTDLGVDEIALSCAFVPPGTPLEVEYRAGEFRPPWLWTVLQIIEDAKSNRWPLSVGGFDDNPPPVAIASNCGVCDPELLRRIDQYRSFGAMADGDENCTCRSSWRSILT